MIARVPPFRCSTCKSCDSPTGWDERTRTGLNCSLRLYQPDRWRGSFLPDFNLGLEGQGPDDHEGPPEPLQDVGCPAGYHSCRFVTSLSPYRPQRYADKTLPGQTSEDPLVQEALRVLSLYVSQSYDRYQEEVVRG